MIRFGIREYIRNFWFNLCIVMLLIVMMIISTALLSNIDEQTGSYRLAEKYMDEDSMYLSSALRERMEELDTYGEMLAVQVTGGWVAETNDDDHSKSIRAVVYPDEVMDYLRPRLDSGTYSEKVKVDENTIGVLISHNPYGLKAGDTFTYDIWGADGSNIPVQVYVAGVLSEGQSLYTESGHIFTDMTYSDFFPLYSYGQTDEVRMIISEDEMKKIPQEKIFSYYSNIMLNPDDDVPSEEKIEIWQRIKTYEFEFEGTDISSPYPSAVELVERNDSIYKSILMKYLPLSVVVILLFSISIIGMVTIKTVKSTRYYGIMYTYGMEYRNAQLTAGLEMGFNCLIAFMATIALLTLQTKFDIVGEINCNLDTLELLVMVGVCVIMVVGAVLTTRSVLKEHTPVEILKNTN